MSRKSLSISENLEIDDHVPQLSQQEWDQSYRTWERTHSQDGERDRESEEVCKKGVNDLELCTESYPCFQAAKEGAGLGLCYDLEGEYSVKPPVKSGQLSQDAKKWAKLWKDFIKLPKDQTAERKGEIQFDQRMERKALERLAAKQRPKN